MFPVLVDRDDAATIATLLHDAAPLLGRVSQDLRDAACYWAEVMTEPLEPPDVGTVAWLLRDISEQRRLIPGLRDRARYWAGYLEGRLAS
jgi:hypothetical protein